jgi:hypothetical protein
LKEAAGLERRPPDLNDAAGTDGMQPRHMITADECTNNKCVKLW